MKAPSVGTGRTEPPVPADEHPSGDGRYQLLEETMKRHQYRQDALIEVLHVAQGLFGFLEPGLMHFVAHRLKLPPSRVYGVATFYHFFTLKPKGERTCIVCTGLACYVKGADALVAAVGREAQIKPGETTPDRAVAAGGALLWGVRHRAGRHPRWRGPRLRDHGCPAPDCERMAGSWNCPICLRSLPRNASRVRPGKSAAAPRPAACGPTPLAFSTVCAMQ
jgi:NADH:ubiquinone oxidoreductase subunit E